MAAGEPNHYTCSSTIRVSKRLAFLPHSLSHNVTIHSFSTCSYTCQFNPHTDVSDASSNHSEYESDYNDHDSQSMDKEEKCNQCDFVIDSFRAIDLLMKLPRDFAENCIYPDLPYA